MARKVATKREMPHVGRSRRVDARGRPRGGATTPCPRCGAQTQVLRTAYEDGRVRRRRECLRARCGHRFWTVEAVEESDEHQQAT